MTPIARDPKLPLVVPVLVVSLGVCSPAIAQAQTTVMIDVDATASGTPLQSVWAFFGYDEANYTIAPEARELLRTLAAAHASPVHVRTHFLFNTGDGTPALKWGSTNIYTETASGDPVYDYTLIDGIMDATVESGTFPLFEIGFTPKALSTQPDPYEASSPYVLDSGSFYPPRDYEKWAKLVTEWAKHANARYAGSQTNWLWELWNEPDIGYWKGTVDEYAQLYDVTEAALHAVLPSAPLGGPAVARPEGSFLSDFLEHCATGTNAVTGQSGTRLDMVSFHAKGGVTITNGHVQMDLGNQLRLHRSGFDTVAASQLFAQTPIIISEADPDGCAACPVSTAPQHAYRNSPAYGAYEVVMMKRSLELAEQVGVELRGILTWAFTFPNTPYFAGYRALATNGIHLPVLNAFKLLASLGGARIPVASSGALPLRDILENGVRQQPDVDALAAMDDNQIQILVWNYHDDLVEAQPANVALRISVPTAFGASAQVTHRRVDDTHANAYTVWQSQGSPDTPSAAELTLLREAMDSLVLSSEDAVGVTDGAVALTFDLPRFGVSLVTLTPSAAIEPESPPTKDASCSCSLSAQERAPLSPLMAISLAIAVARRRRATLLRSRSAAARWAFFANQHPDSRTQLVPTRPD